ncbi:DNA polymerase III subunit delta' [Sulfurospirillum oryzae]|uniref:DNA polymerase III subunit delta' n=1 Tax=Sulfurospirillum oryzae TaxID=2976535 RepID=UPI0021E86932|nr:DNA polymerase III subunit delta' [Sulfurospirillum oryzae]
MKTSDEGVFSHILICKNVEKAKESLQEQYAKERHLMYVKDEFLIDDAKEVIKEAYIAEASNKYLILVAKGYRVEAQNALLKILEEPPRHIVFIVVAPSKTAFLPTIRSRLLQKELIVEHEVLHSGLNLAKLDLGDIYPFIQKHQSAEKGFLKELVQAIVFEAVNEHHLRFSEKELEHFAKLLHLVELNSRAQNILTSLLLSIMMRKYR